MRELGPDWSASPFSATKEQRVALAQRAGMKPGSLDALSMWMVTVGSPPANIVLLPKEGPEYTAFRLDDSGLPPVALQSYRSDDYSGRDSVTLLSAGGIDLLGDGGRQLYVVGEESWSGASWAATTREFRVFRPGPSGLTEILDIRLSQSGSFYEVEESAEDWLSELQVVTHIRLLDVGTGPRTIQVESTLQTGTVSVDQVNRWAWNGSRFEPIPLSKAETDALRAGYKRLSAEADRLAKEELREAKRAAKAERAARAARQRALDKATRSLPPLFRKCADLVSKYRKIEKQIADRKAQGDLVAVGKLAPGFRTIEKKFNDVVAQVRVEFGNLVAAGAQPEVVRAAQQMGRESCQVVLTP